MQSSQAVADDMSQQSQLRPRLEHRTSQTLIDLTDDADDVPAVPFARRPPQLGRSDGQRLAFQVIDLTDDDTEIQITGSRNRELPLPRPDVARPRPHIHLPRPARPDSPRPDSPGLFVPLDLAQPERHINRVFPEAGNYGVMVGPGGVHVLHGQGGLADILQRVQEAAAVQQAMPGRLDYRHPAFADRKPDHVPPEPAQPGFTRTPTESDTIICPSCEDELVYDKETDEPLLKKSGKAPTKKEREEHPFWVVKDCGHVGDDVISFPCCPNFMIRSTATTAFKIGNLRTNNLQKYPFPTQKPRASPKPKLPYVQLKVANLMSQIRADGLACFSNGFRAFNGLSINVSVYYEA